MARRQVLLIFLLYFTHISNSSIFHFKDCTLDKKMEGSRGSWRLLSGTGISSFDVSHPFFLSSSAEVGVIVSVVDHICSDGEG